MTARNGVIEDHYLKENGLSERGDEHDESGRLTKRKIPQCALP